MFKKSTLNILMDFEDDADLDEEVDDIISQIKSRGTRLKNVEKIYPELSPEDIDAFIIKHATKVIIDISDAIEDQAQIVKNGGCDKDIIALSELSRAFTSNIEVLQKRKIADNKNKNQKEVTQMVIDAKQSGGDDAPRTGITFSREEIIKALTESAQAPKEEPPLLEDPVIEV